MKNRKIEWVGKIPEHWNIKRIAAFYCLRNEKVSDRDYPPLSVTKKGILPQLDTAAKSDDGDNRKLVHKGDFAINSRSDRRGSCGISDYDGSVSLINIVLKPRGEASNKYYNWLFHTEQFADEFYKWGNGIVDDLWTTKWQNMKKIIIPVPPLSEQKAIAGFLDKKCGEVDALIADIQQEIETLEQYKRSVITEAVTKGLDPSVPMKESGVGWMPTIPAHWVVHPLYYYFEERKNKNIFAKEHNLLSLSYGKIIRKDINANGGLLPENFNAYNIVDPKDIVLRLTDLQNDKRSLRTGFVNERGIITSAYITLRAKKDIMQEYFYYELHVFDLLKGLYNMGSGVRQGLNFDELSKLKLFEPTMKEQMEIVAYIKEKEKKIEEIIAEKQSQIETLESYKKSLIYEYVTGKKEVIA